MITESTQTAEFMASEANGDRSRDAIVIANSSGLEPGTVLGQVTTSGKFKRFDPAGADGSETAMAVLYAAADASNGDVKAVGISRDAVVVRRALVFADGVDQADKDAAIAALAARGIVAR